MAKSACLPGPAVDLTVPSRADAPTCNQARRRAHAAVRRLRRAHLRRELRGPGGRARAGRLRRQDPDRRPLRGRRAPDVRLRGADRLARGDGSRRLDPPDLRHAGRPHAAYDGPLPPAVDVLDLRLPRALRAVVRAVRCGVRDGDRSRGEQAAGQQAEKVPIAIETDRGVVWRRWSSTRWAGSGCCRARGISRRRRRSRGVWRCTRSGPATSSRSGSIAATCPPATRGASPPATRSGSASARSTHAFTSRSPPCDWPRTWSATRSATRATGSRTSCARRPATASSSSATRPATACR